MWLYIIEGILTTIACFVGLLLGSYMIYKACGMENVSKNFLIPFYISITLYILWLIIAVVRAILFITNNLTLQILLNKTFEGLHTQFYSIMCVLYLYILWVRLKFTFENSILQVKSLHLKILFILILTVLICTILITVIFFLIPNTNDEIIYGLHSFVFIMYLIVSWILILMFSHKLYKLAVTQRRSAYGQVEFTPQQRNLMKSIAKYITLSLIATNSSTLIVIFWVVNNNVINLLTIKRTNFVITSDVIINMYCLYLHFYIAQKEYDKICGKCHGCLFKLIELKIKKQIFGDVSSLSTGKNEGVHVPQTSDNMEEEMTTPSSPY